MFAFGQNDKQTCRLRGQTGTRVADFSALKVGDVVYGYLPSYHREDGEDEIAPFLITNLTITQNKKRRWTKKYGSWFLRNGQTCPVGYDFSFEDIGKKYFLTRSEAEEALAKMGGTK